MFVFSWWVCISILVCEVNKRNKIRNKMTSRCLGIWKYLAFCVKRYFCWILFFTTLQQLDRKPHEVTPFCGTEVSRNVWGSFLVCVKKFMKCKLFNTLEIKITRKCSNLTYRYRPAESSFLSQRGFKNSTCKCHAKFLVQVLSYWTTMHSKYIV